MLFSRIGVCLAALVVGTLTPAAQGQTGASALTPAAEASACQTIVSRYRQTLLDGKLPGSTLVKGRLATLDAQGRWPDINYQDQDPASWKTQEHLQRVLALSRALADPKSPLYGDKSVESAVMRALDLWIAHKYQARNWYFNQIGVPMLMRDIVVLLGDRLTGERKAGALAIWHQYGHLGPNGGANTMWTAELALEYGAETGDSALIMTEAKVIGSEIKVTKGEGIQSDFSFHEHGARLQQFHYGGAFIADASRLAWELHGTPWALPEGAAQLLANTVLQGSQWMCRGTRTVPAPMDRAVSRVNLMEAGLQSTARYLRAVVPQRTAEFDALIARQDGEGPSLVGFRAYPRSDFSVYQRPALGFFLKTVSNRTVTSEMGMNGENLKGENLSCGDHYLLRDGQEYYNLQPVWDWHLLPGITWADGAGTVQRRSFAGSVGDGAVGATAMDYAFGATGGAALTAHKFWACDGDAVVCLISDLRTTGVSAPVRTALDQCRLRGSVLVGGADGTVTTPAAGTYAPKVVRWIHHAGFAYLPLGGQPVSAATIDGAGHWTIFWDVVLPLARPGLIALTVITFLGAYQSFFWPLIMLNNA